MPARRVSSRMASAARAGVPVPALLLALLLAASGAGAQQVMITNTRGLDFGRFVAGSGGTVAISPAGVRSRTGAVVLLNSPSASQASFTVAKSSNGGGNKAVIISLPGNGQTRLNSGSNSMAVNSFASSPSGMIASVPVSGTPLAVGAILTVAPNQAPGTYSGSFSVIVNFQ